MENNEELEEDQEQNDEFEDEETLREIVAPGEVLTEDINNFIPGRGAILNKKRDKIISVIIGLKQIKKNYINVIPLRGFYTPQIGDKVVGIVVDKNPVKYKCDINTKYSGILKIKNTIKRNPTDRMRGNSRESEIPEKLFIGDAIVGKIIAADRLNSPEITLVGKYLGRKTGGIIIQIDSQKVPRIIGRNGSMIKMLKNLTNCNIFVAQNGRIWVKGIDIKHERLLIEGIYKIENEAHTTGLTDRMEVFIKEEIERRGIE
ncbi:MAG: KH domain-containing protein [Candidatus Lokiarchaeota archaeon]|nr:KH domain-containing protein [Candidatus Lokiarchaeota archaeon]